MTLHNNDNLILIVGGNNNEYQELINLLQENEYKEIIFNTIPLLKKFLSENNCMAVLIDIDTISIENRILRELTISYPQASFLCMSKDKYHPELKEAICYHMYACINKPINPDELFYFLRSIKDDNQ